jgi:hypothetical protein
MPKGILMDELHVSVSAPRGLPSTAYGAIHRALHARRFRAELRRAVRAVFRRQPSLRQVMVVVSR